MSTAPVERESRAKPYRATLQDIINQPEKDWNPTHLQAQIASAEERLHLQGIWLKISRLWASLGSAALWAAAILSDIFRWQRTEPFIALLYAAAILSTLATPIIAYQQYKRLRTNKLNIKNTLIILRAKQAQQDTYVADTQNRALVRQRRYREEILDVIAQMREQAAKLRTKHNRYQTVIIVGSIIASAVTTASVTFTFTRWISVAITAAVGLSAGFTGYYKYHENSYNLQQTADGIEREYEAVELRVGRYAGQDEEKAYATFAGVVEGMRDEQNKRQQQLDQPVEIKRDGTSATTA